MHPHSTAQPTKRCARCGENKPATLEHFNKVKVGKQLLQCYCKPCAAEINRAYRMAHKERIAARKKITRAATKKERHDYAMQWRAKNPEKSAELQRRFRERHKEEWAERNRQWREINKVENGERKHAYYEKNKERILEYSRARYHSQKERIAQKARAWRLANRAKLVADSRKRRAQKQNAEGTHSATDIERQYKTQKGRCYYCKSEVGNTYHVDHVVPLSRGGSNGPENLVIACPACNTSKKNKLPHEWPQGGRLL